MTDKGWIRPKDLDNLIPAIPMAVHMRNRFRDALKEADFKLYLSLPSKVWKKP